MGNPNNVVIDVGILYVAPIGTTEPTGNTVAQPGPIAGFRAVGYTNKGSTQTPYKPTISPVYVEEELFPVRQVTSLVEGMVDFVMSESNRTNLALAVNAGANAVNDTTALEPVTPGSELNVMLIWDSLSSGARWLYRQALQGAAVALNRNKAPNNTLINVSFMLMKPLGAQPWKVFPGPTGLV